jgi:hypothetical protein
MKNVTFSNGLRMLLTIALLASIAPLPEAPVDQIADFSSSLAPMSIEFINMRQSTTHRSFIVRAFGDKTGLELFSDDVTLRMLDSASTLRADACTCNHENVLPAYLSYHAPAMYSYSAGIVGFDWLLAHELKQHGHSKLARLPYMIDIGIEAPSLHNFALPAHTVTMRRMPK